MASLNANADTLLGQYSVNMNSGTAQPLFIIPAVVSACFITKVVIAYADASLTTASVSFGFTGATYNDVIATGTHTELTVSTLYSIVPAKTGAKIGVAGETLTALVNILEGAPAMTQVFVFGFLIY